jgi:hypothetical protein
MITIENDGQAIVETNFWKSEKAELGEKYLSWSEGAARLLVPDSIKLEVKKMMNMKFVGITRISLGLEEALDLHFDNHLIFPFRILLFKESYENFLTEIDEATKCFDFCVWTSDGLQVTLRGMFKDLNDELITGAAFSLLSIPTMIQQTTKHTGKQMFPLGDIEYSETVFAMLRKEGIDMTELLQRHQRRDRGCIPYYFPDANDYDDFNMQLDEICSYFEIHHSDMVVDSLDTYHEYLYHPGVIWVRTEFHGSISRTILCIPGATSFV